MTEFSALRAPRIPLYGLGHPFPVIIDLEKFVAAEQVYWHELEARLDALDFDRSARGALDLSGAERLHYLYQRAASDLARLATFSAEQRTAPHPRRARRARLRGNPFPHRHAPTTRALAEPLDVAAVGFPRAFRRHLRAFWLSVAATLIGVAFGSLAVAIDPDAKPVLLPFPQLLGNPADRVAEEEQPRRPYLDGHKSLVFGSVDDA